MRAKILVSIINWNNNQATTACLRSLSRIEPNRQPDIVLIDNHSTRQPLDIDPSVLKSLRSVDIVRNSGNLGFAGAHNLSLKRAVDEGYLYVFLLNNDAEILDENVFVELVETLETDAAVAAVAPTILSSSHGTVWYAGGDINYLTSATRHSHAGSKHVSGTGNVESVTFLTGCCLGIKVSALKNIGVLSDDYFMYWEDADWSARAVKAGFRLLHVPKATIFHNVSSSLGLASPKYVYYIIRGNLFFIKRNIALVARPISYSRVVMVSIKYLLNSGFDPKTIRAIRHGWFDGLRGHGGQLKKRLA